ncbi:glycoside hydrolase family 9 protein [Albibacterium profundi]|uniref:Glycoside hydrolase family 9 protein n=1 Tax=Albibacterium profundi TaxID=3134906 RepID=A0ABV5CCT8_9SPHI
MKEKTINHIILTVLGLLMVVGFTACSAKKLGSQQEARAWIRINQLGYTPDGGKVAVWASKSSNALDSFRLMDAKTDEEVFNAEAGSAFGAYGPFSETYRLDFSTFTDTGTFYLVAGNVTSPVFSINNDVYKGTADFVLRYLRQQRSGFNPYLKDSCHVHDGYTMYGPMPDSTLIDVSGGWHDASDYLQYSTTSANATYHLLAAYRDFGEVFADAHLANGLEGKNDIPDVLDEARWGLEWLMKMHPRADWMFNQLADDRDHQGLRLPTIDSVDYGMGPGGARPVYFITGEPQGLGKHKNRATGTSSTAGKFASAFALASQIYDGKDANLASTFHDKALSAYQFGLRKLGVSQTAPNRAPYFYEEDSWADDMELAASNLWKLTGEEEYLNKALDYARLEKVTPWLGQDTARHYQWYPFHNFGHYEIGSNETAAYYKHGIEKVLAKAKNNAFFRGIPFIWCSNNLTTSFAIQCYLYRKMTGDDRYKELEQANIDWLFGLNPWGTSMVYGLPSWGDTPVDPHSAFTHLHDFPVDGGLVDGPVYTSIYSNLIGITLYRPDEYAQFQSDLAVYHDDFGDYSTNEPTMDGTASLVYLLAAMENEELMNKSANKNKRDSHGAFIRGDISEKKVALIFSADEFGEGAAYIAEVLNSENQKASFFFTGNYLRVVENQDVVGELVNEGHYVGAHSDQHLLYAPWENRDSLLISQEEFKKDIIENYNLLKKWNIDKSKSRFFLPPYEWYNDSIAHWAAGMGLDLVNFTPGIRTPADYTWPEMGDRYVNNKTIFESIKDYKKNNKNGLNGTIILIHAGTDPRRTDKFYHELPKIIELLKNDGYQSVTIDKLLNESRN